MNLPMLAAADIVPHLAKGVAHWKPGYSAHALATTWFAANGLPPSVRALLDGNPTFAGAELVDAILERCTDLRDGARGPSQTDLMAVVGVGTGLAVLAVEGKVRESFGPRIAAWQNDTPARATRLARLSGLLGVDKDAVSSLRYQLFHRAAAAVYEAQRYRAKDAMLLVHSFSSGGDGWNDFAAFTAAIGLDAAPSPGRILGPRQVGGVALHAAWLTDELPTCPG